jgi:tetratricopeptide (TPR) repeat protein
LILALTLFLAAASSQPAASSCPDVVTAEAFVCRATQAQGRGAFRQSAEAFERAAEIRRANNSGASDEGSDRMLAAAGNMWIAAGEYERAGTVLDQALAGKGLVTEQRGEALLDRARAAEAQGDLKTARTRLDEAQPLIAKDPFYWYFAAALAIREGDGKRAEQAIGQALALAPSDPTVLFEAGHVAQFNGDIPGARVYWERAIERDPAGASGRAAREALRMLPVPLTVTDRVAVPDAEVEDREPEGDQPRS